MSETIASPREQELIALLTAIRAERAEAITLLGDMDAALGGCVARLMVSLSSTSGETYTGESVPSPLENMEAIARVRSAFAAMRDRMPAHPPLDLSLRATLLWVTDLRAALIRAGWADDTLVESLAGLRKHLSKTRAEVQALAKEGGS